MIYCFLAPGFEEIEALAPVDILRRAGLDVKLVGVGGAEITGSHGIAVKTDIEEKDVSTDDMDAVILPGGMPGTLNLEKSPIVKASVSYCADNGLIIGAICAAPSILGHMGLLKQKHATCFPGFETQLNCAKYTAEPVTVDGSIVTSKGMGAGIEFGLALLTKFKGEERAKLMRASIQCP